MADGTLDLNSLTLASDWSLRGDAPEGSEEPQPFVRVLFSGPVFKAERRVDLNPLLEVLRARYLQRQLSDRIEQLEAARRRAEAAARALSVPQPGAPGRPVPTPPPRLRSRRMPTCSPPPGEAPAAEAPAPPVNAPPQAAGSAPPDAPGGGSRAARHPAARPGDARRARGAAQGRGGPLFRQQAGQRANRQRDAGSGRRRAGPSRSRKREGASVGCGERRLQVGEDREPQRGGEIGRAARPSIRSIRAASEIPASSAMRFAPPRSCVLDARRWWRGPGA